MRAFTNFVKDFDRASSMGELNGAFQGAIESLGFKTFTYVRMSGGQFGAVTPEQFGTRFVMGTTVPEGWRERYRKNSYFNRDPVIAACRNQLTPLSWEKLERQDNVAGDKNVIRDAREFGLLRGLSVPVHTPSGDRVVVSVASDEGQAQFDEIVEEYQYDIHVLAIYYHEYMDRHVDVLDNDEQIKLSPREIECLTWTANGKTAWEIAEILSISENTVNFHLKNSMAKLNVHSKTHAVAKSISLRLAGI